MGILEQITQMKEQGIPEEDIINSLRQQGISPRQISDAISQSQIKNAVSGEYAEQGMQPSIMQTEENIPQPSGNYSPRTQEVQQEYAPQEGYYDNYQGAGATSTDTIIEIAEQVISEKIQKLQSKLKEITEFKTISETKLESIESRLKRIENIIDKLQIDIIGKISSYGDNLQDIKSEMSMMQDSFGKVMKRESSPENKKRKSK